MEEQLDRLVKKAWNQYLDLPNSKRLLIGVSGMPGSGSYTPPHVLVVLGQVLTKATGKTTLAAKVAKRLNALYAESSPALASESPIATFLPMDGYHLTRTQLSAMPDPDSAHARRGAAFTFDAPAFLALVKRLRELICPETGTIYAPSFDHAAKDPIENDIPIARTARVIVMEGNYLSLGTGAPEWKEAAELMDELWFVEVEEDVARKRLIKRHVASGIAENEEEAGRRADENDLVNGREIVAGRLEVHETVHSKEDGHWKPEAQDSDDADDGKSNVVLPDVYRMHTASKDRSGGSMLPVE